MRNKYGIGFLSVVFILALAVTFAFQYSYHVARQRMEERLLAAEEVKKAQDEETVTADGHYLIVDFYYLLNLNGYVVVFLSDKNTYY